MTKTQTRIVIGAAVAVVLGVAVGVMFSAGAPKSTGKPTVATATREPDSGLQVVVGPPGKAVAPKLPPTVVALPPPTATPVEPSIGPTAVATPAVDDAPPSRAPRAAVQVRPAPARITRAEPAATNDEGGSPTEAEAPPLRAAPPLRPAPPLPPPEPDNNEPDDGPQPPLPPPGA